MHAIALEVLCDRLIAPGSRALDIGCGSGVLVGCMSRMQSAAGAEGLTVGIDHIEELVQLSCANLSADGLQPNLPHCSTGVCVQVGDGWLGAEADCPQGSRAWPLPKTRATAAVAVVAAVVVVVVVAVWICCPGGRYYSLLLPCKHQKGGQGQSRMMPP